MCQWGVRWGALSEREHLLWALVGGDWERLYSGCEGVLIKCAWGSGGGKHLEGAYSVGISGVVMSIDCYSTLHQWVWESTKLENLQVNPLLTKWIHRYCSDCMEAAGGSTPDSLPVLFRVPQGSALRPVLFLLYIDGITSITLSPNSHLTLYAAMLL